MRKRNNKEEERFCTEAFELHLSKHCTVERIIWEGGDEPPDCYLLIGDQRYAVEITSLVASIPLEMKAGRPLPAVDALYDRFAKDLERQALNRGILNGAYSIFFARSIVGLQELEREASEFALEFVRDTQCDELSNIRPFYSSASSRPLGWIIKHHRDYPRVCCARHPIVASDTALYHEALRILDDRVETKIRKLKKVLLPKVLLLLDATVLIDLEHFRASPVQSSWRESFCAAFLVRGNGEVVQLWSRVAEW